MVAYIFEKLEPIPDEEDRNADIVDGIDPGIGSIGIASAPAAAVAPTR
jgi:hypothetical protein